MHTALALFLLLPQRSVLKDAQEGSGKHGRIENKGLFSSIHKTPFREFSINLKSSHKNANNLTG